MDDYYDSTINFVNSIPRTVESVAICGTSYTDTGGIARVIEQQAIELTEQGGLDVQIITLACSKSAPNGVTLHELGHFETTPYKEIDKLLFPITASGLRFLAQMDDVDLVITHRFPFSVLSYVATKLYDIEYVFWSHPSQSSDNLFDGVARGWAKLQHHMETKNLTIQGADYVCAVSEESQSYIESKIEHDAIHVPNTVSNSRFAEMTSRETIEERYDINSADTVILHVGRITPRKGVSELIKSFETVTGENHDCTLVLVGKENMDEYSQTVREEASESVIFTGFVKDSILAGLYDRSDVYATCSLSEGWGLPLSEANKFGTPIVAYDSIPAVHSIENARLVDDGDQTAFERQLERAIAETS